MSVALSLGHREAPNGSSEADAITEDHHIPQASHGRRDTVKARNAILYAKRTTRGQFREMDEKGRSLKADRRVKAKARTKPGYGDRGDRAA